MTIGFVHNFLELGGGEQVSFDTAQRLLLMGAKVIFFTRRWEREQWRCPEGAEIVLLPDTSDLYTSVNTQFLIGEIRRLGIRLLVTASPVYALPTELRERTGCKLAYWLHNNPLWEVTSEYALKTERVNRTLGRRLRWRCFGRLKYLLLKQPQHLTQYREVYRRVFEVVDYYLVLCSGYKDEIVRHLGLDEVESQRVLPLINTLRPTPLPVSVSRRKEIVFVGRFDEAQKQVSLLPKLWARVSKKLPDWSFRIYGSGKDEELIRREIDRLQLERIELCGYIADPTPVYQGAEIIGDDLPLRRVGNGAC